MSQTINNTADASYSYSGSSEVLTAQSNTLPINFENTQGLTLTKTANKNTFSAGEIINYTITITNTSQYFLTGVRIIDNLGEGNLAYVLSSARLTYGSNTYAVTPVATNPLTFTLQQLPVGATMTLNYKAQVIFNLPPSVTLITNNVQGIGYTSTGTVVGYANYTIEKKTVANFSITKSSNTTTVGSRQPFSYYLTLTNNTTTPVNVVRINDVLPANYTLSSVSLKVGSGSSIILSPSDYTLSPNNILSIPSSTGPAITVPAGETTVVTLTGYFS